MAFLRRRRCIRRRFFACDKCAIFAAMAAFIEKTLKTRSKRKSENHTRPLYFGIQINFPM
ncbi:hypothetical protein [Paraburkholderia sp. J94]|uniref:hypothetical protein n=1 Tax=Paraburkholderia sp. J94 TaxID=2805441 RepID=UPI002AAFCAA6|nr:hypothetical protein [Paraburkholderia sp. J94]